VKALAAGADCVTLGSLLAGTSKTPGPVYCNGKEVAYINEYATYYKKFYGMSSKEAQELHRDGLKVGTAAEGISKEIPYRGETSDIVNELLGGIRSGLTYSGANSIKELRERAVFQVISSGGSRESKY
jgi:IMP dehydrogenase